jgi:hypothetical protein
MPMKKTESKERKGVSKHFDSRRGAFRGFKRDYDISNSEQPKKVIRPESKGGEYYDLDERNKRLYIFEEKSNMFGKIKRKETHLREDKDAFYAGGKGNQEQHFNAGYSGKQVERPLLFQ